MEEAQKSSLVAFREYAADQRPTLDSKTPLARRQFLLALRTTVQLKGAAAVTGSGCCLIFAIYLALPKPSCPICWIVGSIPILDLSDFNSSNAHLEVLLDEDEVGFQPIRVMMTEEDWNRAGYKDEEDFLDEQRSEICG